MDASTFAAAADVRIRLRDAEGLVSTYAERAAHMDGRLSAGHWRACVDALERLLNAVTEPAERARVLSTSAKIWEERLRRPDQALLQYQAASRVDREYDAAFEHIRRIQGEQGNWLMVARAYQRQLQVDRPKAARAMLLIEAANVYRRRLLDIQAADALLDEARALDPEAVEAAGDGVFERRGWRSRLERLEAELYGTKGSVRAGKLIEIAKIWVDESDEPVSAEPYLEEALRIAPTDPTGLGVRARYQERTGDQSGAEATLRKVVESNASSEVRGEAMVSLAGVLGARGRMLEVDEWVERALVEAPRSEVVLDFAQAHYARVEDWGALAGALERSLEARVRPGNATRVYFALGELYWRKLDDMERAERYFRRVRLAEGRNPTMLEFYVAYHTQARDWGRVLTSLRAMRDAETEEAARLGVTERMATLAIEKLNSPDRAVDMWTSARAEYPDSDWVRERLADLLRSTGKWNRLLEVWKEELAGLPATATSARISLLMEMAAVYREHFNLPVLEGNAYASILEIDPTHEAAGRALAERFEKAERWPDLVALLRRRVAGLPVDEAAATWRRIGALERDRTLNRRSAASAYERALELAPGDSESFAALRSLYANSPEDLFRIRRAELDWLPAGQQVEGLQVLLGSSGASHVTPAERLDLHSRLVESTDRSPEAVRGYEEALRAAGAWAELVEAVELRLSLESAPSADVMRELARLRGTHAPDAEREHELWRGVLSANPGDAEAAQALSAVLIRASAWGELEMLAGELDDWDVVIVPLRAAAEQANDSALFTRLARVLAERLDDREGQIAMLERAMTLNPSDVAAGRALETAYGLSGNATGRARVLASLIESASEAERRDLRMSLATVLLDDLDRPADAFTVLEPVFAADSTDAGARDRLTRAAAASGKTHEWLARLKREGARMAASPARIGMYYAIAAVAEEHAAAPLEAADYLERIRLEASSPELRRRLVRIYERSTNWERLLPVVAESLEHADGDERVDLQYLSAFLVARKDAEVLPLASLREMGAPLGDHARLRRLRERLELEERWPAVAEVALAEADAARGASEVRAARLAEAQALHADEQPEGVLALRRLCETASRTDEALVAADLLMTREEGEPEDARAAHAVYVAHERWEDAVEALERQLETGADRDPTLREIARVRETALDAPGPALDALLQLRVSTADDQRASERLARRSGRLADAVDAWSARDDAVHLRAAARVLELDLDRRDAAQAMWHRAYDADPTSMDAVDALERLNRALAKDEDLADHLIASAETARPADRGARLREAGEILAGRRGRHTEAIPLFERALEEDDRDLASYAGLERLYGDLGHTDSLVDLLRRKVAVFPDRADVQAAAFRALGDTIRSSGGEIAASLTAYRRALDIVPTERTTLGVVAELATERGALDGAKRREVSAWVTRGLHQLGDTEGLLAFLERRIGVEVGAEALMLHREAARVAEKELQDSARAFHHWSTVIALDDADLEAVNRYVTLGCAISARAEVVAGLEGLLHRDVGPRREIRDHLVRVYLELGEREDAIRHLEAAVRDDDRDAAALNQLEALYRETGAAEDLAAILLARSRSLDRDAARAALREAAQIFGEVVGDPNREADCLSRLQRLEPQNHELLKRLERLLERLERWEELTVVLAALARDATGVDAADQRLRRALVLDKALGDTTRAIAAYRSVLEIRTDDRVSLERLDVLYGQLGMAHERASVVALRIPMLPADGRVPGQLRLARLKALELDDVEGGVALLREVLTAEPANLEALELLEELAQGPGAAEIAIDTLVEMYARSGDFGDAVEVVLRAAIDAPRAGRVALLSRASQLQEDSLNDPDGAFTSILEAIEASRGEADTVSRGSRLAGVCDGWGALARSLQIAADEVPDPGRQIELLLLVGDIHWSHLNQVPEAEAAYQRVLRADPMNVDALRALDELYAESGRPRSRAAVVDALVDVAADENSRLHLLHRSALLHADDDEDLDATVDRYEQILRVDPADPTALARLRALLRRQEAWARLEIHLERMVELQTEPLGRVPLLLELASLRAGIRSTPRLAVVPLAEALQLDPSNLQARRLAESLAGQLDEAPAVAVPVMVELAALYRRNAEWDALAEVLERLAVATPPESATAHWSELAVVREEYLGDGQGALAALGSLLAATPWDTAALDRMEVIAEAEWEWAALYDTLRSVADGRDISRADRHVILSRMARIASDWMGDVQRAFAAYRDVFDGLEDPRPVLPHLIRLASQSSDWVEAASLLRQAAARVSDPVAAGEMLRRSARISDGLAGRTHDAVDTLNAALALDDRAGERTLVALIDLLGRTGDWDAQVERLTELMESAEDHGHREDARLRLAWLRWERFSDVSGAIDLLEPLLTGSRRSGEAFELLATMLRADLAQTPPSPSAHRASLLLEPLAGRRGRDDVLVSVYATRARTADAPRAAAAALVSIAEVHARSGRGGRTELMALREALTVLPGDTEILERIQRVVRDIGDRSLLRRTLLAAAGTDLENDDRAALVRAAASAAEDLEHDIPLASSLHRSLLDARPNDPVSSRELERLSAITGDHVALAEVLRSRLAAARNLGERVDALARLASVLDDDDTSVMGLLDAWVRADRTAADAVKRLERLARASGDNARLATALWARSCAGERDAVAELAELQAHTFSDVDAAITTWSEFAKAHGGGVETSRELAELYRRAERWPELVETLELIGHATHDAEERARVRKEVARVRTQEMDDRSGGLRAYVELLSDAPNDPDAHAGLGLLLRHRETAAGAARALEPIAAAAADHERRLELLDVVLAHTDEPDRQVELALRMADVAARDLGDLERAFEFASIAIRLQPTNALVLHRMRSYAEGMEELERLAMQLEDAAETATQPSEVAWLSRLAGDLWKGPLKSDDRAIEAYRRAAEARPEDPDAAHLLENSLREADRLDELREALGERAERVIGREQLDVYCRLASLAEEQGEAEIAVEAYTKALRVDSRSDLALSGLLRLASREDAAESTRRACADALSDAGRVGPLREFLALSASQTSGHMAARYYTRLGTLAAETNDIAGAAHAYLLALEADPTSREAFAGAARVVTSDEDVSRLVHSVEQSVGALRDPAEQYARLLTAGRLLAERGASHRAAERLLRDAVLADPDGVEAVDALEAVLLGDGRVEDALAALAEFAALAESQESVHRHLRRRIEVAREAQLPPSRIVGMLTDAVARGVLDERTLTALVTMTDDITWRGSAQALRGQLRSTSAETTQLVEAALADLSAPPRRDPDFAISYWRERLGTDPRAYTKLVAVLETAQRWDDLVQTLLSGADGVTSTRAEDLRRAAIVQRQQLRDPLASANTYRDVLRLDPADSDSRAAFEAQMLELGRLDAVIDLLREELARDGEGAVARHLRIAELAHDEGTESELAMEHIEAALSLDPTDPEAVGALVDHHLRAGRPQDAERALRVRLNGSLDAERRTLLLSRLADVLERTGRPDPALDVLRDAFALRPANRSVRERLVNRLAEKGAWSELQSVLYNAVTSMPQAEAGPLWLELVELAATRLENPELTLSLAQEAAATGAASDRIVAVLAGALDDERDALRTIEAIRAGVAMSEEADRRDDLARLYYLQSRAFARSGDDARALESMTASFVLGTGFLPTLVAIARQHALAERWTDALDVLTPALQRARNTEIFDDRAEFFALSGLAEHRMGDVANARVLYAEALEHDPEFPVARDGLRALSLSR